MAVISFKYVFIWKADEGDEQHGRNKDRDNEICSVHSSRRWTGAEAGDPKLGTGSWIWISTS